MTVTNNELQPMFNGSVLMNETAINDQAIMNVLQSLSETNFEFVNHSGDHVTFEQLINPID